MELRSPARSGSHKVCLYNASMDRNARVFSSRTYAVFLDAITFIASANSFVPDSMAASSIVANPICKPSRTVNLLTYRLKGTTSTPLSAAARETA